MYREIYSLYIYTGAAKSMETLVFRGSPQNDDFTQKSKYKFLLQIFCVNFEWRPEGRISYRLGATLGMDP